MLGRLPASMDAWLLLDLGTPVCRQRRRTHGSRRFTIYISMGPQSQADAVLTSNC